MANQKTLIILHGWGLSGDKFDTLVKEFINFGYSVYNPDLPGFGKSKIPLQALTLEDYAEFLRHYQSDKHLESVIVVGHSFGGRIALKYQEMFPEMVSVLVLTGTPGLVPVNKIKLTAAIIAAKIGKLFFSLPVLNRYKDKIRLSYYRLVGVKDYLRAQDSMRETFKNIVRSSLISAMQAVHIPTLLIWGETDTIVPVKIAKSMQKIIKGSALEIITGFGHNLPYVNPQLFAKSVNNFLRNL